MEKIVSKYLVFCGKLMVSVWREIKNLFKFGIFIVIVFLKFFIKGLR